MRLAHALLIQESHDAFPQRPALFGRDGQVFLKRARQHGGELPQLLVRKGAEKERQLL